MDLFSLSCEPTYHNCYSQCEVNGVRFVTFDREDNRKTQNSVIMVETDDDLYYGVLEDVIELIYPYGVTVVVFKCRWFNEDTRNIIKDHGLESVDTSAYYYEDTPYCLASTAKQVFYIDDPKRRDNWKVVYLVARRGIYNASSIARNVSNLSPLIEVAYQEDVPSNIPEIPIDTLNVDFGWLLPHDSSISNFQDANVDGNISFEDAEDENEDENLDEDDENEQWK